MGYTPIASTRTPRRHTTVTHVVLFVLTCISTVMAGTAWAGMNPLSVEAWPHGFTYAILIMTFLGSHELGHYVAARMHGVDVSLPYFLPMPIPELIPFGTMGAVIRAYTPMTSRRVLFDVAVAGPIAGFVVCLVVLAVGYATLPPIDYLYGIHPELRTTGPTTSGLTFGDSFLFSALHRWAPTTGFVPPMNEIYHYPFLCVGWFGLLVTGLNLLPFGQLDGGHILYGLIGRRQHIVGRVLWLVIVGAGLLSAIGFVQELLREPTTSTTIQAVQQMLSPALDAAVGSAPWLFSAGLSWLFYAALVRFFVKIDHPVLADPEPLDTTRMVIGWGAMLLFVLCFTPSVIYIAP